LPSFEVPVDIDVDMADESMDSGSEITPRTGVKLPANLASLPEPAPRPMSASSPALDIPPPPASLIESVRPPPVAPGPLDLQLPQLIPQPTPLDLPPPPLDLPPPPLDLPPPPVAQLEGVAPAVSPPPPAVLAPGTPPFSSTTAIAQLDTTPTIVEPATEPHVPPIGVGPALTTPSSPHPPAVQPPIDSPHAAPAQVAEAAAAADAVEVADVELVEENPAVESKRAAPPPAPPRSKPSATRPKGDAAGAVAPIAPVQSSQTMRPRVRVWWEELFTDDFVRSMDKLTPDQVKREVRFIEESLAVSKGGVMLDLGCGTGQHAVELAARGYSVVGYDLSLTMLALAADEAQSRGQKLNFLQGDMREMAFEEMFDGVFSWSTSFGYFDHEKNCEVIRRVQRALRTGGMFLLDIVNRDYLISRTPTMGWFEGDGCVCMDEVKFDAITSRLLVKRTLMLDDGRAREIEYSIRLYSLHEIGKMVNDAGFKVVEVSGHPATAGVFMGAESPRLITLAEKR
jgi:ubiquinone/menaquinone biosynthesis C-methylase UbiE